MFNIHQSVYKDIFIRSLNNFEEMLDNIEVDPQQLRLFFGGVEFYIIIDHIDPTEARHMILGYVTALLHTGVINQEFFNFLEKQAELIGELDPSLLSFLHTTH